MRTKLNNITSCLHCVVAVKNKKKKRTDVAAVKDLTSDLCVAAGLWQGSGTGAAWQLNCRWQEL